MVAMGEPVVVPGARDVRGTLDRADHSNDVDRADHSNDEGRLENAIVVACPPHPNYGGDRTDRRLRAVADRLVAAGIDCLRFDYGPWDEGPGERSDAANAIGWADARYDRVGLFGFSFGGTIALVEAAENEAVDAASALAPTARLSSAIDAVEALDRLVVPSQIVYGTRDSTADWEPIVDRVRAIEDEGGGDSPEDRIDLVEIEADHFFVGQTGKVAEPIGAFFEASLR